MEIVGVDERPVYVEEDSGPKRRNRWVVLTVLGYLVHPGRVITLLRIGGPSWGCRLMGLASWDRAGPVAAVVVPWSRHRDLCLRPIVACDRAVMTAERVFSPSWLVSPCCRRPARATRRAVAGCVVGTTRLLRGRCRWSLAVSLSCSTWSWTSGRRVNSRTLDFQLLQHLVADVDRWLRTAGDVLVEVLARPSPSMKRPSARTPTLAAFFGPRPPGGNAYRAGHIGHELDPGGHPPGHAQDRPGVGRVAMAAAQGKSSNLAASAAWTSRTSSLGPPARTADHRHTMALPPERGRSGRLTRNETCVPGDSGCHHWCGPRSRLSLPLNQHGRAPLGRPARPWENPPSPSRGRSKPRISKRRRR